MKTLRREKERFALPSTSISHCSPDCALVEARIGRKWGKRERDRNGVVGIG